MTVVQIVAKRFFFLQEGDFKDGKIDGHAVFRYPNGDQREGFYRENMLDGQVGTFNFCIFMFLFYYTFIVVLRLVHLSNI